MKRAIENLKGKLIEGFLIVAIVSLPLVSARAHCFDRHDVFRVARRRDVEGLSKDSQKLLD